MHALVQHYHYIRDPSIDDSRNYTDKDVTKFEKNMIEHIYKLHHNSNSTIQETFTPFYISNADFIFVVQTNIKTRLL